MWDNADEVTRYVIQEFIRTHKPLLRLTVWQYIMGAHAMTATSIINPDGTKSDSHDLICEGCEQPVSDHSCGGATTILTGAAAAAPVRTAGRKKDPADIVPCPHCGGRMHMNLPAATVNFECFMRQWYVDTGVITDPINQRLPLWGLDDLKNAVAWAESLARPITYGKMESAAGGSGTYASTRPKADPKPAGTRAKKRKPAEAGERIEDLAADVTPDESGETSGEDDLGSMGGADYPITVSPDRIPGRSKRKPKRIKTTDTTISIVDAAEAEAQETQVAEQQAQTMEDLESDRQKRRAERRALLAGVR